MNVTRNRIVLAALLAGSLALTGFAAAGALAWPQPAPPVAAPIVIAGSLVPTSAPVSGRAAVARLGTRLPAVARSAGWSTKRLVATLLTDPTLHVDSTGHLFYIEPKAALATASATTAPVAAAAAPYALSDTFKLHSLPGAKLTVLLDFGGGTLSGDGWTHDFNAGKDIVCPPWSLDGNPAFSDAEKTAIQEVWQRVAEDYAPFNVDVTTEFTTEAAITRSSSSDKVYGTRVLISPIGNTFAGGGIAYVGAFSMVGDYYKPALVFPEMIGNTAKSIAEAAAHECGHNVGLDHDGTIAHDGIVAQGYYGGSGTGVTAWAPIMGVSYSRALSQWSKGEYPYADNHEDDLTIISGYLGSKTDDVGDTTSTASVLSTPGALNASGLVGGSSDTDVYRFESGGGAATIDVTPSSVGPDLDVYAAIEDPAGTILAWSNPASLLSASISANLQPGTYYLVVRGTGKLTPLDVGGYSSYSSLGPYTVNGTIPAPLVAPVTTLSGVPSSWTSATVTFGLSATDPFATGGVTSFYRIGPGATTTYTGPVAYDTEGATTLAYWSRDAALAPHVEAEKTATIRIDRTAPTVDYSGPTTLSAPAAVSVAASDSLSGVASTTWALDGAAPVAGATATTSVLGHHSVLFETVDAAGNPATRTVAFDVVAPSVITLSEARFRNSVAYDLKALLTSQFLVTANVPALTATLTVATPGQNSGSVTVFAGALANAPGQRFALPAWNGLVGGARLKPANYQWTLTVSKPGSTMAPVVKTGSVLISNIYIAVGGAGSPTTQDFLRYMLQGGANVYISARTTSVAPQSASVALVGPAASGYGKLAATTSQLSAATPWNPATVKLTLPVRSTTAQSTWYTVSVAAPPGSTYAISVVQ